MESAADCPILPGRLVLAGAGTSQPSLLLMADCNRCRTRHTHGAGAPEAFDELSAGPRWRTAHCRGGATAYGIQLDPAEADRDRAVFDEYRTRLARWEERRRRLRSLCLWVRRVAGDHVSLAGPERPAKSA